MAADYLAMQGAITHGIDLVLLEYSCFSTRGINSLTPGRLEWNFVYVIF